MGTERQRPSTTPSSPPSPVSRTKHIRGELVTLLIGHSHRAEMRPLVDWLTAQPGLSLSAALTITSAVADAGRIPDLVIVLQSWSAEYSSDEISQLFLFAPLARLVVCYGAWCESDGRNFSYWPLSIRVPVWNAIPRIVRERKSLRNPAESPIVPWSASREEAFLADHPLRVDSRPPLRFLVDSPDPSWRAAMAEQMLVAGGTPQPEDPQVILFDADPWTENRRQELKRMSARYPKAHLALLTGLPDPHVATVQLQAGASMIAGKLAFGA